MTRTSSARDDILRSIRDNLAASASYRAVVHDSAPEHAHRAPLPLAAVRPSDGRFVQHDGGLVERFRHHVTALGGACDIARREAEAGATIARILSAAGARHVVVSDAPLVTRVLASMPAAFVVENVEAISRDALFACDAGITTAQMGIAETGTLVLESAREKHRLLSLVPPIHVALLAAADIRESVADVIGRLADTPRSSGAASHAVTFITGPSRTSDIELTLTIGVHGPRMLHVIILESDA